MDFTDAPTVYKDTDDAKLRLSNKKQTEEETKTHAKKNTVSTAIGVLTNMN